jgi:hypothetical protein
MKKVRWFWLDDFVERSVALTVAEELSQKGYKTMIEQKGKSWTLKSRQMSALNYYKKNYLDLLKGHISRQLVGPLRGD